MNTPEIKNDAVATVKKDISAQVLSKIDIFQKSGQIQLPADYSPANALKSAYLILAETKNKAGNLALEHCTTESIGNALLKMVVWGLSPLKKQCNFIMYGKTLDCTIEYTGNIALAKRYGGLKDYKANAVFKDDVFEFEVDAATGRKKVTKHTQTLESMSSLEIKGAYMVLEMENGTFDTEIMSLAQIKQAWNQGAMKGNSPAHKNFPDQMCIKTVINRGCKPLIRSSNDGVLYDENTNQGNNTIDTVAEEVKQEINDNANAETLDIDAEEVKTIEVVDPQNAGAEKTAEEKKPGEPNF